MIYKGRAIHWELEIKQNDKKFMEIVYYIVFIFAFSLIIVNINDGESIRSISLVFIFFILIFSLIKWLVEPAKQKFINSNYYLLTNDLEKITENPEDKNKPLYAYLEFKKTGLILNGYFCNKDYFFTKKYIKYEDILNINTNFKNFCKIEFNIKNDLNEDKLLKLNLFNLYSIDRKAMIFIYNKVKFMRNEKLKELI